MTCDTWHMTHDKQQVTPDTWHVTRDTWHMVWVGEQYEKIGWFIPITVWEWLKSDMLHLTRDTWHVTHDRWFLRLSYIPQTIWLGSKMSIFSKSTSFLLRLDLHCNLPNFINVSNISVWVKPISWCFLRPWSIQGWFNINKTLKNLQNFQTTSNLSFQIIWTTGGIGQKIVEKFFLINCGVLKFNCSVELVLQREV